MILDGETLYNIAAALGFAAYLLSNVLWLRILLVIGACFYIYAGNVLGLTSMIGWHIAYVVINLAHVVKLLLDRHATSLSEPMLSLYSEKFSAIKPREFKRIMGLSPETAVRSKNILEQGQHNEELFLITEGVVEVRLNDDVVTHLGRGEFFGEMSFLSHQPVTSDVLAEGEVKYIRWSKADMQNMQLRNLSLYNRFMMAVGLNVVEKLRATTAEKQLAEAAS